MNARPNRRSILKGLSLGAGASLLGPLLSRVQAQSEARPLPLRFVFLLQSNGMSPSHILPSGVAPRKGDKTFGNDATIEVGLADRELPDPLVELAPFKDQLTLIQGLSGQSSEGGTGGHSTNHGALGCYPGSAGPIAQTIDCALGDVFPGIVRHVGLGVLDKKDQTLNPLLSCLAPGKAQPLQCVPEQAFRSLFGSVLGGADRAGFENRAHVLQYVGDDVRRARTSLSADERAKLDEYLAALETLRIRQGEVERIEPKLRAALPKLDAEFAAPTEVNRMKAHVDIAAAALISGLTNSVTIASGGGHQNYLAWPDLGITVGGHGVGHGESCNGMTPEQIHVKVRKFHAGLIASLATKLAAVREGDGTMLDRTLIVYLSDSGEAHHPNLLLWPVVLLGGMGGKLKPGGRYVQLPAYGAKRHRTLASLYLTLLQAAGRPRESFGIPDSGLRDLDQSGCISELLA
jgi:hypothetical protein